MVFGGEGLEEEGGEGGGGDVLGSEAEDVLFLFARIELELPWECGRAPLLLLCRWEFRLYCLVWYFKQIGGM